MTVYAPYPDGDAGPSAGIDEETAMQMSSPTGQAWPPRIIVRAEAGTVRRSSITSNSVPPCTMQ